MKPSLPKHKRIGTFTLTSPRTIATDPSYCSEIALNEQFGCVLSRCAVGTWNVTGTRDEHPEYGPMVRYVTAVFHEFELPPAPKWIRAHDSICCDTALTGVFDLARFKDPSVVPKGQKWTFNGGPAIEDDLWYSYVCEKCVRREFAVVPFGFVAQWDGGMDLECIRKRGVVVAIRLAVSDWPAIS